MRLAGIDGCKGGWVVVHAPAGDPAAAEVSFAVDLRAFMTRREIDFAVVDIPIGFSSGPGDRDVEASMRAFLKGKASSVFNTPCRQALYEDCYASASSVNREVLGKGLSQQTFAIFPKMQEMDGIVRELGQDRIREGHPEVSFAVLNGAPVLTRKKDPAGSAARLSLLERAGFHRAELAAASGRPGVGSDDVIDAAVLLWTARRSIEGRHETFPKNPSRDAMGLEMSVIA